MWTNIAIKNFRVIGEDGISLPLAPLTVFVGENGTGKSTILEALALTAQTVHDPQRRRELVLSGELVDLPTGKQWQDRYVPLHHKKEAERNLSVELEWSINSDSKRKSIYPPNVPGLWGDLEWPPHKISYCWELTSQPYQLWGHCLKAYQVELVKQWQEVVNVSRGGGHSVVSKTRIHGFPGSFNFRVMDELLSAQIPLPSAWDGNQLKGLTPQEHREQFEAISDALRWMVDVLVEGLKHVSVLLPLRGLQLTQKDVGPDVRIVGKHGEQTFRLLASLQSQRYMGFELLRKWASHFGMKDLKAAWAGGHQLKVDFLDPYNDALVEADEGATGSRQMLILLSHLLLSPTPMTCVVEEPECNLHPAYEKKLPELFADSIQQGHQLLVSTHSEIIIAALGQAVRSGKLQPSDVKIWHLERKDAQIQAQEIAINHKGRLQGWVKSFAQVEEELFDEWLEESPADKSEMDP